jgi:hypothetical protein
LRGQDDFVREAGRHKLLYEKMPDNGWPIDVRVGRHNATIAKVAEVWSQFNADQPLILANVPGYREVSEQGVGAFLRDPSQAPMERVVYE